MGRLASISIMVIALLLVVSSGATATSAPGSPTSPLLKKAAEYRSCVAAEPALAMVADLHRVNFKTACRLTKKIASYPWPESDRVKITKWCWNRIGGVTAFDGWNVKVRGIHGPATLSRGGRWFAFQGQEFPISCV